jgi:hypothetical protein
MNAVIKLIWVISLITLGLCLLLSYGYLPISMTVIGMDDIISKTAYFNSFVAIIALLFFVSRLFQNGIKKMNWAFLFPLAKKWMKDPETRDSYREAIYSWITSVFALFNLIFLCVLFLVWGLNDQMVYHYQNVFGISLFILVTALIFVLIIPPFIIYKGPREI